MTDPYRVLGVTRDASTDEIKKAYRTLSRKYHPDANINNPNKDQAEEMFKQIQQAYKQIMDEREGKTSSYGGQGYGGNFINNRMFREAMNVLNQIAGRSAQWYYLHAVANYGMGNNINAVQDAMQAVNLEPDNFQYRQLLQQLQGGGQWYTSMGEDYGFDRSNTGFGSFCCQCLAINALCNCCC